MSRFVALNLRQLDITFQVPTTVPPHAVTFGQVPPVPVPEVPPDPAVPVLVVPPVPVGFSEETVHPAESVPNAMASVRTAD